MVWFQLAVAANLDLPSGPGSSAASVATRGDQVELVWIEPSKQGPRVLHAVHSGDGWSKPSKVFGGEALFVNWADTPVIGHAGDGSSVVAFPRRSGEATYAYDLVVSRRDGDTWRELGSPHRDGTPTEHGFPSIVPEGKGFRVFWLDGRLTGDGGPMTLRTTRWNGSFDVGRVVDDRVCDCCGTDALVFEGKWTVVYRDRSEAEIRDIKTYQQGGGAGLVSKDGWQMPGCPVNGPRMRQLPGGPLVAWTTGVAGLEVRASFGGATGVVASADEAPAGRVDLVVVGAEAVATWLGRDGVYARRLVPNADGLQAGPAVKLASTGSSRSTGFPRAAVHGDELWMVWTGESGLVGSRTPLSAIPAVVEPLPVPTKRASQWSWDPRALKVQTLKGKRGALRLQAPMTLVTTWASWCGPCRMELDALRTIQQAHPELDLQVVAVDDTAAGVKKAARQPPGTWWMADRAEVRESLGSDAVPHAWLIDDRGEVVWSQDGALLPEAIDSALEAEAGARR